MGEVKFPKTQSTAQGDRSKFLRAHAEIRTESREGREGIRRRSANKMDGKTSGIMLGVPK